MCKICYVHLRIRLPKDRRKYGWMKWHQVKKIEEIKAQKDWTGVNKENSGDESINKIQPCSFPLTSNRHSCAELATKLEQPRRLSAPTRSIGGSREATSNEGCELVAYANKCC